MQEGQVGRRLILIRQEVHLKDFRHTLRMQLANELIILAKPEYKSSKSSTDSLQKVKESKKRS